MPPANATYLYCLVRAPRQPDAGAAPAGLPECGAPRVLDAGARLWLVVADAPLGRYGAAPLERDLQDLAWVSRCAVAHEKVVEHFLGAGTVVPMKLLTLFASDASALAAIAARREGIDRAATRVEDCREYGLRLLLDKAKAERAAALAAEQAGAGAGAGAAFLLRKRGRRDALREKVAELRERARAVVEELAQEAAGLCWRPPAEGGGADDLAADAALLVHASAAQRLADAVQAQTEPLAEVGLRVVLTGPWPAYHFVGDAT